MVKHELERLKSSQGIGAAFTILKAVFLFFPYISKIVYIHTNVYNDLLICK